MSASNRSAKHNIKSSVLLSESSCSPGFALLCLAGCAEARFIASALCSIIGTPLQPPWSNPRLVSIQRAHQSTGLTPCCGASSAIGQHDRQHGEQACCRGSVNARGGTAQQAAVHADCINCRMSSLCFGQQYLKGPAPRAASWLRHICTIADTPQMRMAANRHGPGNVASRSDAGCWR